jgi:hypothetical protein
MGLARKSGMSAWTMSVRWETFWAYCAMDAETNLVPTFKVRKRNRAIVWSGRRLASAMRMPTTGSPDMELVSTSYIERLNATTRIHVKRLSRLNLAFSKKLENFEAGVALHFAYHNS